MTPSSAKRRSSSGKIMLALLGACLTLAGLAIPAFFGRTVIQAARAGDWVTHPCTIDSTVVRV
ncbi:MAG TPA: hypothetical protein VHM91_25890, partial [Verrucomicrobiales bacterium]|nr:hypothetical protein [Verrucomicrobiales bacterium]